MKVYEMKFHLYECIVQRRDHTARAYLVAPTQDAAWLTVVEHEEALGLDHDDLTLKRIDHVIDDELRHGLDDLLETAPVGFASFADRWIAHTAPVQQLKLYRTLDDQGGNVFAIAPNPDVAASMFTKELRIRPGEAKLLRISDGMADLPDAMVCNLPRLLEFGPIGVACYDPEEKRWFVC